MPAARQLPVPGTFACEMQANQLPLVSVVIAVYNGERFLAAAIASVLAQTYPSVETILVDDGSTDRTPQIALSYSAVKYHYQANAGIGAARNRGVARSTGDYLAFLDADDAWLPTKLSLQVSAFQADPSLEVVSGLVEQFVEPGQDRQYAFPGRPQPGYGSGAMLLRRQAFEATGGFPEDSMTPDVGWIAGIIDRKQRILVLPHVIARRRIHGGNSGLVNRSAKLQSTVRALKQSIERKRASQKEEARE